ncbi:hypothetical protein ERO13_A12G141333v2, partial [Gossypium hirsutum]
ILRYLQGIKNYMLTYERSNQLEAIGYSDSNFVGCLDSRKSIFGYLFLLAERAMLWKSDKQFAFASMLKVESVACFDVTIHTLWLQNFISRLGEVDTITKPLKIYCDDFAV